eukprot:IDg20334t1
MSALELIPVEVSAHCESKPEIPALHDSFDTGRLYERPMEITGSVLVSAPEMQTTREVIAGELERQST